MTTDEVSEAELYATDRARSALPWPWRLLAAGATLAALALLALVLAYWGWRWFGPTPATLPPPRIGADALRVIADAHLFGPGAPAVATNAPSNAVGDLRLLGVFAQRDGQGYALFRAGTRGALFVAAGADVAPGIRLEAIRPGGVTLLEGGARREMALRPASVSDQGRVAVATSSVKQTPCSVPIGFAGPILRLNAELLSGMISAPGTWKALLQPGPGGLIVRDQSGFAGMMGLRNGDRVERANGIALSLPEDIAGTVLKPLTRSQAVWVSGSRDGKPQQWLYLNAGACPA
ncbi:MAG TPA: type II secretion system protein N [Casimicrobiaceae bacterium]